MCELWDKYWGVDEEAIDLNHEAMTRIGITCNENPSYMHDSIGRWSIVENANRFWSYVKHF